MTLTFDLGGHFELTKPQNWPTVTDRELISSTYRFSTISNLMVKFSTWLSKCVTLTFDLGGHFDLTKSENWPFSN